MRAFIYTGGKIYPEGIIERPGEDDLVIAADAGYISARELGAQVNILVGDFDSLGGAHTEVPKSAKKITLPCEKDVTDTQYATELAIKQGAQNIIIVGGLDGRLDHTLSNLALLEALDSEGVRAIITNGQNRVRYIRSTSTLIPRSHYKYLSILCCDESAKGVRVEGCKYPLKNARLNRKFKFAVSNEITQIVALVSVRRGGIYIIESRDDKSLSTRV
jgi:thiamine pyrophosphokinase